MTSKGEEMEMSIRVGNQWVTLDAYKLMRRERIEYLIEIGLISLVVLALVTMVVVITLM